MEEQDIVGKKSALLVKLVFCHEILSFEFIEYIDSKNQATPENCFEVISLLMQMKFVMTTLNLIKHPQNIAYLT